MRSFNLETGISFLVFLFVLSSPCALAQDSAAAEFIHRCEVSVEQNYEAQRKQHRHFSISRFFRAVKRGITFPAYAFAQECLEGSQQRNVSAYLYEERYK